MNISHFFKKIFSQFFNKKLENEKKSRQNTPLFSQAAAFGLEKNASAIKAAKVAGSLKKPLLISLSSFPSNPQHVKQLYKGHPVLVTGFEGKETLVRLLSVPLTKEKDIIAALSFQAEPLLPYPIDQALLCYQLLSQSPEESRLTLSAIRKETMDSHLESWRALQIEPERIASVPIALSKFGMVYFQQIKSCLILHIQPDEMTCILLQNGLLSASFARAEGLKLLLDAAKQDERLKLPDEEEEWEKAAQGDSPFALALRRLLKEIAKMIFALSKENRGEAIEGIAITGEGADLKGFSSFAAKNFSYPSLTPDLQEPHSAQNLLSYAVPIGLALSSMPAKAESVDFRQQEWNYPYPWKRLKKPLFAYFAAAAALSLAFYFFGRQYLLYQESELRQNYLELLAEMHKTHDQFEKAIAAKNSRKGDSLDIPPPPIEELNHNDLTERLLFLQKELQTAPDSFPLFANIPRVGDVLAWLNQYSSLPIPDEEAAAGGRLKLENFSYIMLKRPQQGKKQEKYQVKVEFEFSSPTPKWAREFHDALIAPNDWVDPKGEVKWNSNKGRYKTSFFLKDKTGYPGS